MGGRVPIYFGLGSYVEDVPGGAEPGGGDEAADAEAECAVLRTVSVWLYRGMIPRRRKESNE